MADSRIHLFAPQNSKLEERPLLAPDSDEENDEELRITYFSDIEVDPESGAEISDLLSETKSATPDYFLLKIELLRRLLDECLASIESGERSPRFKKRYLPLAFGLSLITAGTLILLTGALASIIPSTRYNKIAGAFGKAYKTTPIPNNIGLDYACDSVDISLKINETSYHSSSKLDMGNPRMACNALSISQQYPNTNHLETTFWGPTFFASKASHICLVTLSELCKEFNKTFFSKDKYMALVIGTPIGLTLVAMFLVLGGVFSMPRHVTIRLDDLALSPEEKERIKAIMGAFKIDLTNHRQPVGELRTQLETIKEDLNNVERRYFTENNIFDKKLQGQHLFFSTLLEMANPETINMNKADLEDVWSTAKKAALFK